MKIFKRLSQRGHSTYESGIFGVTELNCRPPFIHTNKWDPLWAAWDEIERTNSESSWVTAWTVGRAGPSGNPWRNRPFGWFLDDNNLRVTSVGGGRPR